MNADPCAESDPQSCAILYNVHVYIVHHSILLSPYAEFSVKTRQ